MNFFIQMKESVIDVRFYNQIRRNRFAKSFTYLLLLYFIIYCMHSTIVYLGMQQFIGEFAEQMQGGPDFRLSNGEFSFQGKMPFKVGSDNSGLFIIDTTGQTTGDALRDTQNGLLITKDYLIVKQKAELRKFALKDLQGATLTKADVLAFLPTVKWLVLVGIAFLFIFACGWKLLNSLLLALIGLAACEVMKTRLKFSELMNMAVYALTLPLLIELAVFLSGIAIPYFFVIYWFVSIAYMLAAVKISRDEPGNGEDSDGSMLA